jgi:hypothetical protein
VIEMAVSAMRGLPDLDAQRRMAEELRDLYRARGSGHFFAELSLGCTLLEAGDPEFEGSFERVRTKQSPGTLPGRRTHLDPTKGELLVRAQIDALLALMRGEFDEAEKLVAWVLDHSGQRRNGTTIGLAQLFLLRREQGRLAEVTSYVHDLLEELPQLRAFETALALGALEQRDDAAAVAVLERLTANGIVIPRDNTWTSGLFILAETAGFVRHRAAAEVLLGELKPHAGHLAVAGVVAAVLGAIDRSLGQLYAVLGDYAAAERNYESAIAAEERIGAHALVARSRYWYAACLLDKPDPEPSRARELLGLVQHATAAFGMPRLREDAGELAARTQ